ncbi:hypothetical protein [Lacticaseibacillus suihuaensis]
MVGRLVVVLWLALAAGVEGLVVVACVDLVVVFAAWLAFALEEAAGADALLLLAAALVSCVTVAETLSVPAVRLSLATSFPFSMVGIFGDQKALKAATGIASTAVLAASIFAWSGSPVVLDFTLAMAATSL